MIRAVCLVLQECTFRPRINPDSAAIVEKSYKPIHRRLGELQVHHPAPFKPCSSRWAWLNLDQCCVCLMAARQA